MGLKRTIAAFGGLALLLGASVGCNAAWADSSTAADGKVASAGGPGEAAEGASDFAARGEQTCMRCHDKAPVTDILATPHAMKADPRTPFGKHACESCHGVSRDHYEAHPAEGQRRPSPAVVFKGEFASPVADRNAKCLACHQNGLRMNWQGSQHESNNIACNSCHTIHVQKDPVLVKQTQPDKCFTCHAEQQALTLQFSHHPIREGKVACSDCHNPHGSAGPDSLKKVRVTDTCYTCHADKRGPMLWEHQPVREDCTNCHNPHGSQNARLLKEKVPFLCLDCHAATNDMGGYGYKNSDVAAHSGNFYLSGDRSCLNCHSQIHGSNSPSGSTFFR
ncbi:MAG: DmsE family decaheme c-type cytochrome [Nevskia sp.]|nr:DmsE family decaheme c-type cytochrome [Nevskia sp.]